MNDLILDHVSKRYQVQHRSHRRGRLRSLLQTLAGFDAQSDFWALRDISFEVARGETLGIIGHNGAGKSTILKLLSKVTTPTSGEIRISGRLSALIEVGSGFHPELTGRENIFLSGSILGMRHREIVRKLEGIVDFAGVRDFIDTPVKHFSSGMYVRLGFSIAAHLEPDILLLDEVLAVGDATFQAKCLDRINQLHRQGRTIVFISHDLVSVEKLCGRVLLLDYGRVIASGPARDIIGTYQEIGRTRWPPKQQVVGGPTRSGEIEITSVTCEDESGHAATVFRTGDSVRIRFEYLAHIAIPDAIFELYVYSMLDGLYGPWFQLTTASEDGETLGIERGREVAEYEIDELSLLPGICYVSARIAHRGQPAGQAIDWQQQSLTLRVDHGRTVCGTFYMPHRWRIGHTSSPAHATSGPELKSWSAESDTDGREVPARSLPGTR